MFFCHCIPPDIPMSNGHWNNEHQVRVVLSVQFRFTFWLNDHLVTARGSFHCQVCWARSTIIQWGRNKYPWSTGINQETNPVALENASWVQFSLIGSHCQIGLLSKKVKSFKSSVTHLSQKICSACLKKNTEKRFHYSTKCKIDHFSRGECG